MSELCVEIGSLRSHFVSLTDPRHTRNRKHLLVDIVVISICGILCGASGPTAIHRWAKSKHEWLAKPLALPHGIPSRDCLRRLLMVLSPEAFQKCFEEWIASGVETDASGQRRLVTIDGKSCRRSHDASKNWEPLHIGERIALTFKRDAADALPLDTPLFTVPAGLVRILDRDLDAAGIAKRDERGRTIDVHALRHSFGTQLSKGGVAPRTAQATMRRSDIALTMTTYTDPKLLHVQRALNALPSLPLTDSPMPKREAIRATGTEHARSSLGQGVGKTGTSEGIFRRSTHSPAMASTAGSTHEHAEPPMKPRSGFKTDQPQGTSPGSAQKTAANAVRLMVLKWSLAKKPCPQRLRTRLFQWSGEDKN